MKELGVVKKIDGKFVSVAIAMHDGCESCMNGSCKAGRSALKTYNSQDIDVIEGDEVRDRSEERLSRPRELSGSWDCPWSPFLPVTGWDAILFPTASEAPAVASAGLLFAIALAAGFLVQKARKTDSLPILTRKCG